MRRCVQWTRLTDTDVPPLSATLEQLRREEGQ